MSVAGTAPWSVRINEDTCLAGPWCDRLPGEALGFCQAHYQQHCRGQELRPVEGSVEALLARVVPQPDLSGAACAGVDTDSFVEVSGAARARSVARICSSCPVLEECRDWAYATHGERGIRAEGDPWPVRGVFGGVWFKIKGSPVDLLQVERSAA